MPHTKKRILIILILNDKDEQGGEYRRHNFAIWSREPYHTERRHYQVEAREMLRKCIGFRVPHSEDLIHAGDVEVAGEHWTVFIEDWAQFTLVYDEVRGHEEHDYVKYLFKRLAETDFAEALVERGIV